ncbi:MAG TPA: class I SAM-dependent methyltransferase [Acidobacteriota bacterium]|nr:class I SAM-dependent methyltransferase [Acidobacteriota bacterium]
MDGTNYDTGFYADIAEAENSHFWFRHRAAAAGHVFEKHIAGKKCRRLLEVGAGTCYMARYISKSARGAEIVCTDLNAQGLRIGKSAGNIMAAVADLASDPFKVKFDVICMFDVLEHIGDDMAMLSSARQCLAEDGALLLTVPAGPSLWSDFDVASGHKRRYTGKELEKKLELAGLRKVFASHLFSFLVPLMRVSRRKKASGAEETAARARRQLHPPAVLNFMLSLASGMEMMMMKAGARIPFGTSIIAAAVPREKPI